ncbi:MAG: GGDEF domain-containing protein [Pseudomarimonas sp.]
MIRDDTLNLVILLLNLLLGGLCFAVARGERPAPALRYWGWGLFLYTFGLLGVLSSRILPTSLAYFFGNALITLAPLISMRALLWHGATRFDSRWAWAVAVPVITVLAWNNFVGEFRPVLNFVLPTLVAIAAFVFAALRLLERLPADTRATLQLVAVVSLTAAALWSVRLLLLLQVIPVGDPANAALATVALAIGQILVTVAGTFALLAVEVRSMEQALKRQVRHDALTGLPNRWAVAERFEQELARAARQRLPFGLLLLDIDHFKRINDAHGHVAGDAVLRCIAATLASNKRTEDLLARFGGEEFLLLFVDAAADSTQALAKRLNSAVESQSLEFEAQRLSVTISGGLAMYPHDGTDWQALYAIADQRLYQAKHRGRNQICGPWNTTASAAEFASQPQGGDIPTLVMPVAQPGPV